MSEIEEKSINLYISEYTMKEKEEVSRAVFRQIANTILPKSIKVVEDTPDKHPS